MRSRGRKEWESVVFVDYVFLVLVGEDGVVLEGAGGEGPVHRVAPGEGWRGLTATSI